jgi:integrating conjugative element protein (TIGR03761 family)
MSIFEENEKQGTEAESVEIKPVKTLHEEPGGLRNSTRMFIQTRQAQKLVAGRKREKNIAPIIGLMEFGRRMKLLWMSAEANDPYADWHLVQIEDSINEARVLIQEKKAWLDDVLLSMDGFEIEVASSLKPINVSIYFQNPFGYMGAFLIKDFDALACSVFTARHLGIIDRSTAESMINTAGKAIRRTFVLVSQWKFTGVTRDDIQQDNQNAKRALDLYGECPADILSKDRRAKTAPAIRARRVKKEVTIIHKNSSKENEANEEKAATKKVDEKSLDLLGLGAT